MEIEMTQGNRKAVIRQYHITVGFPYETRVYIGGKEKQTFRARFMYESPAVDYGKAYISKKENENE